MPYRHRCLISFVAILFATQTDIDSARATTIAPVADARIINGYGPVGNDGLLSVYTNGANIQRTLLLFDFSALPTGYTVNSAVLTLHAWNIATWHNSAPYPMDVYRLTKPWVESEVSATEAQTGVPWTGNLADGDFVGVDGQLGNTSNFYARSNATPSTEGEAVTWDITALVHQWYAGTAPNYGLLLRSYEGSSLVFYDRSASNTAYRPSLTVELSTTPAVPEPRSVALLAAFAVGLGPLFARSRRNGF